MTFKASHYLVRVQDLRQAVCDYERAGFTVVWGSDQKRAHNAMIYFSRGGFIELFNPMAPGLMGHLQRVIFNLGAALGSPVFARAKRWMLGQGLCDFALETTEPLQDAANRLAQRDVRCGKVRSFSRRQADGVLTRWELCSTDSSDLPFLMGPYDPPPELKPEQLRHGNGISDLLGIVLAHPNPPGYADQLCKLLGGGAVKQVGEAWQVVGHDFNFVLMPGRRLQFVSLVADATTPAGAQLHGLVIEAQGESGRLNASMPQ